MAQSTTLPDAIGDGVGNASGSVTGTFFMSGRDGPGYDKCMLTPTFARLMRNAWPTTGNPWRFAWRVSLMLHVLGLGLAVGWWMQAFQPPDATHESITVDGSALLTPPTDLHTELAVETSGSAPLLPDASDPQWRDAVRKSQPSSEPERPAAAVESFVEQQIQRSIDQSQQRSDEDNLDRLAKLSRELRSTTRRESVDEMAGFLNGLVQPRTEQPVADPESRSFDVETAQLHDVKREAAESGEKRYIAVMIDAQGVTREVELDVVNGEQLYRTMKLIRSNPLLEHVYRKIVMGILDNVLRDTAPQKP